LYGPSQLGEPLAELIALYPKRQYCLPYQLTNLKRWLYVIIIYRRELHGGQKDALLIEIIS